MRMGDRVSESGRPAGQRPIAMAAFVLVLLLAAWRGVALFDPLPAEPSGSAEERRLAGLVETLVGEGNVRIALSEAADGARTLLVLIDEPAAGRLNRDEIAALAGAAGFYREAAGDVLTLKALPFARSGSADGRMVLLELAAFAALALLTGWQALTGGGAARAEFNSMPDARSAPPPGSPKPLVTSGPSDPEPRAGRVLRQNPARAAAIVRAWIADAGGAR